MEEEYKKYAELTKISCCTAQNCEALNNAIREGIENQKLREEIEDRKYDMEENYIPKLKVRVLIGKYRAFSWHNKDDEYWANRILDGFEELLQEGDK